MDMTKEEIIQAIEQQKPIYEKAYNHYVERQEFYKGALEKAFENIVDFPHKTVISFGYMLQIRCSVLINGKVAFGTEVEITLDKNIIRTNVGTCGSFTIEDKDQINKYKIMASFWDNYDYYSKIMLECWDELKPYGAKLDEERRTLERYQSWLEVLKQQEEKQRVLDTIKVNNIYECPKHYGYFFKECMKRYSKIRVDKITDKCVFGTLAHEFDEAHKWYTTPIRVEKSRFANWVQFGDLKIVE